MSEREPRILVEGGPVDRRVKRLLSAVLGFVIGTGCALGYVLVAIHENAVTNCHQIEVVKGGLVLTLREAEHFAESSPVRSPTEKRQIVTFYRDALGRLRPRQC